MKNTLKLCRACTKKNHHLKGIMVYIPRGTYSPKHMKDSMVRELKEKGLPNTEIAKRAEVSLRQVYRITRGK